MIQGLLDRFGIYASNSSYYGPEGGVGIPIEHQEEQPARGNDGKLLLNPNSDKVHPELLSFIQTEMGWDAEWNKGSAHALILFPPEKEIEHDDSKGYYDYQQQKYTNPIKKTSVDEQGQSVKYRADVAGIRENTWSTNAKEYDTEEEAKAALDNLASRWFGFDLSRVVPSTTPRNQPVDMQNDVIYQNMRR